MIIAIDEFVPPQRAGQEIELDLECLNSTWSAAITFDAWRQRELPNHDELLVVLSDDLESQAHKEAHRGVFLLDRKRRLGTTSIGELGEHCLHEHGSGASVAVGLEQRYEERWRLVVDVAVVVHYAREAAADDLAVGFGDQDPVVLAVTKTIRVHPESGVFDDAAGRLLHAVRDEDGFVEKAVEKAELGWRDRPNRGASALVQLTQKLPPRTAQAPEVLGTRVVDQRAVDIFHDMVIGEPALLLNSLRLDVAVVVTAPKGRAAQILEGVPLHLSERLGDVSLAPVWNADPESDLHLCCLGCGVGLRRRDKSDAADGPPIAFQAHRVRLGSGEEVVDDFTAVLDARVNGPARYGSNGRVACIAIKVFGVRFIPRTQDQPLRFKNHWHTFFFI